MESLVILFSGGLDSTVAKKYAEHLGYNPKCLYVDMGHKYSEAEKSKLPKDTIILNINLFDTIISQLDTHIIPSRNVLLATIGSMFGNKIWICALKGEQNGKERDKSDFFFDSMTSVLTETNSFFYKNTVVETPFRQHTKADVISLALKLKMTEKQLIETSSCYNGNNCGECIPCVKRHIAFKLNGIDDKNWPKVKRSNYYKELCIEIPKAREAKDYSRFDKDRINEFYDFLAL